MGAVPGAAAQLSRSVGRGFLARSVAAGSPDRGEVTTWEVDAEAYYHDKAIPYHLRYTDLAAHRAGLTSGRIVLTHMSGDMLAGSAEGRSAFETAHDGLTIQV